MLLVVEAVLHVSGSLVNLVYLCNYILKALKELGIFSMGAALDGLFFHSDCNCEGQEKPVFT